MVIDSSAFVAILLGEPEQGGLIEAIVSDPTRLAGAPTMVEASMVLLARRGEAGLSDLRAFVSKAAIQIASFGPEHVELAVDAFGRFGKGRHPAASHSVTTRWTR